MNKFSRMIALAVMAAVAMVYVPATMGADEKKPEAAAKPHPKQCTGEIVSISADCITLKAKGGEQKFAINPKTKYGSKTDPKTASDFKAGEKATVFFKEEGDQKTAVGIRTPAAHKPKENK